MGRFPVHSDRQSPISIRIYNGVQEGDSPILLIGLHCKLDGRVNTVNVLYEFLFIDFPVPTTYLCQNLGVRGQYGEHFAQSAPYISWLQWG